MLVKAVPKKINYSLTTEQTSPKNIHFQRTNEKAPGPAKTSISHGSMKRRQNLYGGRYSIFFGTDPAPCNALPDPCNALHGIRGVPKNRLFVNNRRNPAKKPSISNGPMKRRQNLYGGRYSIFFGTDPAPCNALPDPCNALHGIRGVPKNRLFVNNRRNPAKNTSISYGTIRRRSGKKNNHLF